MPKLLIEQAGPLPITKDFTQGSVGPATLIVSGSVWTSQENTLIGMKVLLDGQSVGDLQIFSNGPTTHRSVVPKHFVINLDKQWPSEGQPPTYSLTLQALNQNTNSDLNDNFQAVLIA